MSKLGSNTPDYLPVIQKFSGGNHGAQRKCGDFCADVTQTSWLDRTQRGTAESNIEKLLADRKQCHYHLSKQHDPAFVCPVGAGFGTLTRSCCRGRQGGHLAPGQRNRWSLSLKVWVCRAEDATMNQPSSSLDSPLSRGPLRPGAPRSGPPPGPCTLDLPRQRRATRLPAARLRRRDRTPQPSLQANDRVPRPGSGTRRFLPAGGRLASPSSLCEK